MTEQQGFARLKEALQQQIIGQPHLVERLLICLLSDGHLLVEGAPGLAKTKAINALADRIEGDFKRIQFTPTCCPAILPVPKFTVRNNRPLIFRPGPFFTT